MEEQEVAAAERSAREAAKGHDQWGVTREKVVAGAEVIAVAERFLFCFFLSLVAAAASLTRIFLRRSSFAR